MQPFGSISDTFWVQEKQTNFASLFVSHTDILHFLTQRAKKVLSDSPGLVDFATGLVNSVFNLPDGQVMFYEEFE